MSRGAKTAIVAVVAVIILGAAGVYGFLEYRYGTADTFNAAPPSGSEQAAVGLTDVSPAGRTAAQDALRTFAASVVPGYTVADERLFAERGSFQWAAMRVAPEAHFVRDGHYRETRDDVANDPKVYYLLFEHGSWLSRQVNSDMVLFASVGDPVVPAATPDDELRVYGYFKLRRV